MIAQINRYFIRQSLKKTYTRYLSYVFYEGRPLTTKGRWLNPLIFGLYRLQSMLPFAKKVIKPVFILGTGRSGTTILGITLSIHKDVGFLNEPKALWSYLIDSEDLIGSYREEKGRYRLFAQDSTPEMIKRAHRIYGHYLRFGLATRVIDKYPELIFRTAFVTSLFPDARYLFLYRNGYDTCRSINTWSVNLGVVKHNVTHDWWGCDDQKWQLLCSQVVAYDDVLGPFADEISRYDDHTYRAAVEWIVTMKEGVGLITDNPDFCMGVKYEDYVRDAEVRKQVLKFCDLDIDPNFVQFSKIILKPPKAKPPLNLPPVLESEFLRVMKLLNYQQFPEPPETQQ